MAFFYPFIFNKFFSACWFSLHRCMSLERGNTENLTFQAVLIMYWWMSTPHFVRVGSLHGLIFAIHITKSVKQSVQNVVASEFAIYFSELDRIFCQMPTGIVFWNVAILRRAKGNEFIRWIIPDLLGWRSFLFIPKACYSRLFHLIYIWAYRRSLGEFTGVLLARYEGAPTPAHR